VNDTDDGSRATPTTSPPDPDLRVPPAAFDVVEDALLKLWGVANDLSKIQPAEHDRFRVTIFGSARTRPGQQVYAQTRELAAALSRRGIDIVSGGGPGIMQAANEGENLGDPSNRTRSIGIRVELPFEQDANPFVEELYVHRTFFTRLHQFVRLSSAFVVVGGGIGTTLETMMIWQLLQVRQIRDVPLIFVGEMWRDLVRWARTHMLSDDCPLASPVDLDIPVCVGDVSEVMAVLEPHLKRFEASRGRTG